MLRAVLLRLQAAYACFLFLEPKSHTTLLSIPPLTPFFFSPSSCVLFVLSSTRFCRTDEDVAAKAHGLFETPDEIPNDLKSAVYKIALQSSSESEGARRHAALMCESFFIIICLHRFPLLLGKFLVVQ